jgi:lysophospholipase L1-like esterase
MDVAAVIIGGVIVAGTALAGRGDVAPVVWVALVVSLAGCAIGPRLSGARLAATVSIAAGFAALGVALFVAWHWPMLWFLAASALCVAVAAVSLVKHADALDTPVSRLNLFALAAIGLSTAMALVLSEAAARIFSGVLPEELQHVLRADPRNYGVAHAYIGHLHRPSASFVVSGTGYSATNHTDSVGFRNPDPWPARADVVVIGDSVVFGWGVDDDASWPARFQAAMPGKKVMNLGLAGGSPQQYLRVYETFGAALRPKLVLVGLWARNDFTDAEMFDDWERSGAGGNVLVFRDFGRIGPVRYDWSDPIGTAEGIFHSKVYPLLRRSYLYNLMRVSSGTIAAPRSAPVVVSVGGRRVELSRNGLATTASAADPSRRGFRLLVEALRRLHETATADGAQVLIVIQPTKEDVYLPGAAAAVDPLAALRSELDAVDIEYLDLTPTFREHASAGRWLYFDHDSHPNRAGYALIASAVHAHIMRYAARYGL